MVETGRASTEVKGALARLLEETGRLGRDLSDEVRTESERVWVLATRVAPAGLRCEEDISYGPHGRHRLDVYHQSRRGQKLPVLVFVHGGGFTGGDKRRSDGFSPQNVGDWAVGCGMVGVNITYRLAPDAQWPAVTDDISAALTWVIENIDDYGGDPECIFLMGHSAGAAHVAGYVAHCHTKPGRQVKVKGAVLLSGIYDIAPEAGRESVQAYYGTDPVQHRERSSTAGVALGNTPLFIVVAEYEPASFFRQGLQLASAVVEQQGVMPLFAVAEGHNHFSEIQHVGSDDKRLSNAIASFVLKLAGRPYVL